MEWITKPSSSSSVTQAQCSLPSNIAAKAAYSTDSLSTVTPSIASPSCTVEEGSKVSLERGGAIEGQETGSHVPPAAAYCQVCSSDEEGGDDKVTDCTWVPERREEESEEDEEAQLQQGRLSSRGQFKGGHSIASHCRAPQVQGAADSPLTFKSSLVWAFFDTCAADRTVAVCNLCLKRMKHGQNSSRLGTTCLTRHMMTCHAVYWQQHLKDTS
ncbi:hypothetical protein AB205_0023850 [Aquarana catesbeiana]|uniref:BED-type domain-containing protein n=1 Tax=Aquarana catesbeiana TaxID=8400 RepID=A0A2G9RJD9_AQUCT|nr:hypothetical protein AB205_0023850 [Aquarana catesbeiana]